MQGEERGVAGLPGRVRGGAGSFTRAAAAFFTGLGTSRAGSSGVAA